MPSGAVRTARELPGSRTPLYRGRPPRSFRTRKFCKPCAANHDRPGEPRPRATRDGRASIGLKLGLFCYTLSDLEPRAHSFQGAPGPRTEPPAQRPGSPKADFPFAERGIRHAAGLRTDFREGPGTRAAQPSGRGGWRYPLHGAKGAAGTCPESRTQPPWRSPQPASRSGAAGERPRP
jgi:hypothetical protein